MFDRMEGQQTFMPPGEEIPEVVDRRKTVSVMNLPTIDPSYVPGDNARYLRFIMEARTWPKIDTGDPEQLSDRINMYFEYCAKNDMKPTVSGLASAIGVSRIALWKWKAGVNRPQNYAIIEDAYNRLEELWEMYMMNGKISPPNGIFLGKNHFGYKDVQDLIVAPANPLGDTVNAEVIEEKYRELPPD